MHAQRLFPCSAPFLASLALLMFGAIALPQAEPHGNASSQPPPSTANAPAVAPVNFQKEIFPVLKARCGVCHNANRAASAFSIENILKGGAKNGEKTIVPYSAADSVLLDCLRGNGQPKMPPSGAPLSEELVARIELWINQGASVESAVQTGWPYTSPRLPTVPNVRDTAWVKNPIDNFVLAKLEAKRLTPAPPASRHTLLRRVYADLIGIPPTPTEAFAFLKDSSPGAFEKLVDKLLTDPRYGERWGRHWLDLVRYAESDGGENDRVRPRAWRYRDYVIRALNADKPYDRFLKEQLAGDELFPNDPEARIATGYLRLGPGENVGEGDSERRHEFLTEVTDTTSSVMLGLTVGCARCHDHKYDPVKQPDYYRMQAFFAGTRWSEAPIPTTMDPSALQEAYAKANDRYQPLRRALQEIIDRHKVDIIAEKIKKAEKGKSQDPTDREIEENINKVEADRKMRDTLREEIEKIAPIVRACAPVADAATDFTKKPPPTYLLLRGERYRNGKETPPGYPVVLCGGKETPARIAPVSGSTSGRRATLANWIASKENPLTARVMVNRLWQKHFGYGIVRTPSDFGKNGDPPSHPELLDYLAVKFMEEGWSLKKMHRLMLTSNAYRQSTKISPAAASLDPENRLLSRMTRQRLEGEALRDAILAVCGRLNPTVGGPGIYPKLSEEVLSNGLKEKWGESTPQEARRRSIYVFQRRSLPLPFFEAFDSPDMSVSCPARATTINVPQALTLFNAEFCRTEAQYLARSLAKQAPGDWKGQIERAYWIVYARPITEGQSARALKFVEKQSLTYVKEFLPDLLDSVKERMAMETLTDFCHVLLNSNEFLYLD